MYDKIIWFCLWFYSFFTAHILIQIFGPENWDNIRDMVPQLPLYPLVQQELNSIARRIIVGKLNWHSNYVLIFNMNILFQWKKYRPQYNIGIDCMVIVHVMGIFVLLHLMSKFLNSCGGKKWIHMKEKRKKPFFLNQQQNSISFSFINKNEIFFWTKNCVNLIHWISQNNSIPIPSIRNIIIVIIIHYWIINLADRNRFTHPYDPTHT